MIGHSWAETLLGKHIRALQVRHAYLISGDDGIGKRTLAIQFARALNCTNPGEDGEICGDCRACSLIKRGAHPDFHELKPEEGSATIKVDQIRDLQHQLALSFIHPRLGVCSEVVPVTSHIRYAPLDCRYRYENSPPYRIDKKSEVSAVVSLDSGDFPVAQDHITGLGRRQLVLSHLFRRRKAFPNPRISVFMSLLV